MRRLAYLALIVISTVAGLAGWLAGSEHGLRHACARLAGGGDGGADAQALLRRVAAPGQRARQRRQVLGQQQQQRVVGGQLLHAVQAVLGLAPQRSPAARQRPAHGGAQRAGRAQ